MSNDRANEYLLVVELRQRLGLVSQNISDTTKRDYAKKFERMKRMEKTPETAGSKKSYYAYRAALLYGISQEAKTALRARDKAPYLSDEWQAAMQVLQRCQAIFERYPPDPERAHQKNGSASFTWVDVQAHKAKACPQWSPTVKSKKRVLSKLSHIDDWHSKLFTQVTPVHKNAAAVCSLTGARPSEVARGVIVQVAGKPDAPYLLITIRGTKLTETSGQPERRMQIKINSPEAQHLLGQCQNGNPLTVITNPVNLTAAIIKAGKLAFPQLKMTVSPYVLRHSVSAELKASGISEERIAQTLGHQVTKSQQAYGHSAYGSGAHNILAVAASTPVRQTHRHPDFLRLESHGPSVSYCP